ncbi:MAG: hypothetical protein OFPII_00220 [Osedax symbiont Rs1]|nr:MAG: hypothetical protein OFPII_00220 [Osedax symbiont Rs1]
MMTSIHRYTALVIALVLLLISLSGIIISLEENYRNWKYPQLYSTKVASAPLNLAGTVAQIRLANPALIIEQIVVKKQAWIQVKGLTSIDQDQSHFWLIDPESGKLLDERPKIAFFEFNLALHKSLLSGEIGQWLAGAVTLLLSLILLSGLISYLPLKINRWLASLDVRANQKRGRSFWLHLHSIIGIYSLFFVLSSSVTGVNLSFSWAANSTYWLSGLSKQSAITAESNANDDLELPEQHLAQEFPRIWSQVHQSLSESQYYRIDWPYVDDLYDVYRVQSPAVDSLQIDCKKLGCQTWLYDRIDGSLLESITSDNFNLATKFQAAILPVHTGLAFGSLGKWLMLSSTLACFLLSLSGTWLYLAKLNKGVKLKRALKLAQPVANGLEAKLALIERCSSSVKVIYISHSGNAQLAASQAVAQLSRAGFVASLYRGDQYQQFLTADSDAVFLFYISTTGAGEVPGNAGDLLRQLRQFKGRLNYAVFALGDRAYPDFCLAGELLSAALAGENNVELMALKKSEQLWLEDSQRWLLALVPIIASSAQWAYIEEHQLLITPGGAESLQERRLTLNNKTQLTRDGAKSTVFHLQFNGDLSYRVGDLLGIYAENNRDDVRWIIQRLGFDAEQLVPFEKRSLRIEQLLAEHLCLYPIAKSLHPEFPTTELKLDLKSMLIKIPNWYPSIDFLLQNLVKLRPRYYSIASCPKQSESLDLCVALLQVDRQKYGMCSGFLCQRLERRQSVRAFVKPNNHFQLPSVDKNIIMIATGSGVAPYIGFMQARIKNSGAQNWLILGNRHPEKDYLFEQQLNNWSQCNNVRLDLSFSRVTNGQYVQQHIKQNWSQIIAQLRDGAVVYVCGSRQLGDAIREIFSDHELWPLWLENQQYREDIFG